MAAVRAGDTATTTTTTAGGGRGRGGGGGAAGAAALSAATATAAAGEGAAGEMGGRRTCLWRARTEPTYEERGSDRAREEGTKGDGLMVNI